MMKVTIAVRGVVFFIGLLTAVVAQRVGGGNYIVPRTTLNLGQHTNKSAAGRKRRCMTNKDCEGFVNSMCCLTTSGYNKCRKRCRKPKVSVPLEKMPGCDVGGNKVYKEGATIAHRDGCNKCTCKKGKMRCTKRSCPPAKCKYKGGLYAEGYRLVLRNGCKSCKCQRRMWNCTSHPCEDLKSRNDVTSVYHPSILLALVSSCSITSFLWLS